MVEERAIVKQVLPSAIEVESFVKSSCSQCHQVDNCGNGQVAKALPQKKLLLTIPTTDKFVVGDEVMIAIPEQYLLKSAWQVYMWPLIGVISFAGVGQLLYQTQLLPNELLVVLMSIVGGFLGSKLAKWWQIYSGLHSKLVPKIMARIPKKLQISPLS
jgi:sigma-E factor negative regulatory protein RseC